MIMKPHNTRGLLITFCGLDGCGKTTMIRKLKEFFKKDGISAILTKQPTNAVRSSAIFRTYMDSPNHDEYDYRSLSLLCASDRVQHSNRVILPLLSEGNIVISDRYFYSCLANLHARGYTKDRWIYEIAAYVPKPDLAFFLDVSVQTAIQRVRSRNEERNRYIDVPLQYRLREEYLDICKSDGGILVDSSQDADITFSEILRAVGTMVDISTMVRSAV